MMEPDDLTDSDTESVCSTASASSFSSERRTAIFAKFSPSITTDQLYDHFADNGFDKTKVDIRRRTDRATGKPSANAMVLTTSREEEIISLLNGTVIMGKCTLTVEPFCRRSKNPIRKSASAVSAISGTSPEIIKPDYKGIALYAESESCRVFVGARLPEDITEKHIRQHFHEFNHAISKVDCIRDKHTNASKGYFFVTFRAEAYANMAIRSLNQSLLLGKYKLKVELQKSYPNSSTIPSLHKVIVDLDPRISNDEIKALIGVPVVKVGSMEPNAHQRYLQFQNQHDAYIAIQNLNGKNLLGKTVHAYSQNECMQRPSKSHYGNQGSFQHPILPPLIQRSDSQPLLHGHSLHSYPQAMPLVHPVNPVFPPLQSSATSSNACPHSSTQRNLSQDSTLGSPNVDQNLCYPVKITRLPMSVSDEALNALFSQAGEILGKPIFHSSEQPYAHVNFKHKSGAQSAVQRFNGTIFCRREIRVSAQKPKALNSQSTMTTSIVSLDRSSNEEVIEPKRDRAKHVKVLNLDSKQWNQLMTMQPNGTSLYQEVISPFKANPNVTIETEIASCAIKMSGTPEAVSSALDHVKSYIYKELQITERIKLEALVEIYPNLPHEIHEKHGVLVKDFEKSTMVLRFDGPSPGKVSAWTEVNNLLSSAHVGTFDVSFSVDLVPSFKKRLQIDRIQTYVKVCKDPPQLTICSFDESTHKQAVKLVQSRPCECSINALPHVIEKIFTNQNVKSIQKEFTAHVVKSETDSSKLLVQGFWWDSVKTARDKLLSLVQDISKEKKLTREESLYLKHRCENYPDQFTDVQIKRKRGGNMEVLGDREKLEKYLSGLMFKRYTFKRRFQQQITSIILCPLREEKCLDFIYIFEPSPQLRHVGPTSKVEEETFQVLVYSKDQSSFNEVCGSLDTIKPTSHHYRFRYHPRDLVQQVKLIKSELESTYHVCITERERGAYINGLKPDDVHKCREIIDEAIRSKVIITKTISDAARHELKYIKRRYGGQFEDEYDCRVFFLKDRDEVQIKGKIKDVEVLEGRIKELIEAEVHVESFSISCIGKHFGMWKKRWMTIKKEQEESEVIMDFIRKDRRRSSSSSSSEFEQEIEVTFEIIGPDPDQLLEIKELLCKEDMEKRVLDVPAEGITALLTAKRQGQFDRLGIDMNIDKRMNKVILQSPQGLAEDLETAELEIQKFVGIHASTHKDLTFEEPIIGLVLSSKTKSVPYLATANSFARANNVVVHSLRLPRVGLRLRGNPTAVNIVQEFVQAHVVKQIEANIKEEKLSISQKYSTVLSSSEFTRFDAKLKQDYCVLCSYPICGQLSKAAQSALIDSLNHSVRVDICRGNLVQERVDAIVNAANMDLKHIGGLAKAISDAGGPSIQTESNRYVQSNGKVPPGNCVVLGAGALPCKRIVHAVGPRWVDGTKKEEETLYFTVLNCLQQASKDNLSSVAFPAISTGVFGMPEDICARASLKAVLNYLQGGQTSTVTAIRFVLYTPTAFQAFKSSFKSIILPCTTIQCKDTGLKPGATVSSSGQWLWADDSGSFSLYSPATAVQLTQEFSRNPTGSFQCLISGKGYIFDFANMTQTNISTGYQRKIQSGPLSSSAAATTNQAVQWQYCNDQRSWSFYQPNESQIIETMYKANTPGNIAISGRVYAFDFTNMHQINTQTGHRRTIHRILSPQVPVIAAQQQPMHEQTKQETTGCNSKIMIVLRGPRDSLQEAKVKVEEKLKFMLKSQNISFPIDMEEKLLQIITKHRVTSFIKEVEKDTKGKSSKQLKQVCLEGTSFNVQRAISAIQEEIIQYQLESKEENEEEYPQEWEDQAQTTQVFVIQQGNPEWNKIEQLFKTTMPNSTIIQISRIQNTWLWGRYVFQRKRLGIKNGGSINERDLFHGTRSNDPKVIYENEDGFDMRYSAQGMWGQANYFAVNASYSHNYAHATPDGTREMFLVKVLTGDSYDCPSNSSLRKPPMKTSGPGASGEVSFAQVQYDTVTGVTNGSRVYMIYDNDKAYPAYLIKYK